MLVFMETSTVLIDSVACLILSRFAIVTQVLLICTVKQATHGTVGGRVRMLILTGQAELSQTAAKEGFKSDVSLQPATFQ